MRATNFYRLESPLCYRPSMSRDSRTKAYTVRYNEDEDELIKTAAEHSALEVGSWIRMVSVKAARQVANELDMADSLAVARKKK